MTRLEFYIRNENDVLSFVDLQNINKYQKSIDYIDWDTYVKCRELRDKKNIDASDFAFYRSTSVDMKSARKRYNATRVKIRYTLTYAEFEMMDKFYHSIQDEHDYGVITAISGGEK